MHVQGSTNSASGTLITAMSRLASESKADAPLRNAHRKRKMQEAPPCGAAAGLNKLKPSTMSLPPVSLPKQTQKPAASASVPTSAVQRSGSAQTGSAAALGHSQPQSSGSKQAKTGSQSNLSANKRAKHEQINDSNASYLHRLATPASAFSTDADTMTDGSSQHQGAAQLPAQTFSSSNNVMPALTRFFDPVHAIPLTAQASTSIQDHAHKPEARGPVTHSAAEQDSESVAQHSSMTAPDCTEQSVDRQLAADSSMAALADAAAAASEGSAESSSSHAGTDDDKDAAAILRELRSSPSPQPSSASGQCESHIDRACTFNDIQHCTRQLVCNLQSCRLCWVCFSYGTRLG